ATFEDFGDPLINKHGQVVATGLLTNGAAGLFVGDGRDAVAIALDGQAAPSGGTFSGCCTAPLTLNDRGEVAFHAGLRVAFIATLIPGIGGVDLTNNMGIWVGTSDA